MLVDILNVHAAVDARILVDDVIMVHRWVLLCYDQPSFSHLCTLLAAARTGTGDLLWTILIFILITTRRAAYLIACIVLTSLNS